MPEPISSSAATSTLTGLALLFTLPGVDPAMVLSSLTGAVLFISATEEHSRWRKIALFVVSFIVGLVMADLACQLLGMALPTGVTVSKAVGALISSALMVRLLQAAMRTELGTLLNILLNRRG
ncbi:TPA: putative holin [Aeromonas veronii]